MAQPSAMAERVHGQVFGHVHVQCCSVRVLADRRYFKKGRQQRNGRAPHHTSFIPKESPRIHNGKPALSIQAQSNIPGPNEQVRMCMGHSRRRLPNTNLQWPDLLHCFRGPRSSGQPCASPRLRSPSLFSPPMSRRGPGKVGGAKRTSIQASMEKEPPEIHNSKPAMPTQGQPDISSPTGRGSKSMMQSRPCFPSAIFQGPDALHNDRANHAQSIDIYMTAEPMSKCLLVTHVSERARQLRITDERAALPTHISDCRLRALPEHIGPTSHKPSLALPNPAASAGAIVRYSSMRPLHRTVHSETNGLLLSETMRCDPITSIAWAASSPLEPSGSGTPETTQAT